jgi:hypothetical protein
MAYLGRKPLSETAPNHPFARMQIGFGVTSPASSMPQSRAESAPEESQAPAKPEAQS